MKRYAIATIAVLALCAPALAANPAFCIKGEGNSFCVESDTPISIVPYREQLKQAEWTFSTGPGIVQGSARAADLPETCSSVKGVTWVCETDLSDLTRYGVGSTDNNVPLALPAPMAVPVPVPSVCHGLHCNQDAENEKADRKLGENIKAQCSRLLTSNPPQVPPECRDPLTYDLTRKPAGYVPAVISPEWCNRMLTSSPPQVPPDCRDLIAK